MLLEVVGGKDHAAATGEVLHDQPGLGPGSEDAVPVAVADMPLARAEQASVQDEGAVVAAGPEQVPGLPVPPAAADHGAGDVPRLQGGVARQGVQRVDVQAGAGEHQRLAPLGPGLGPVREDALEGGVAVGAGVQPSVLAVLGQAGGMALPEGREARGAFPGLAEPVDLLQGDAVAGVGEGGEHPAGAVDDPDLARVPDQDVLRRDPLVARSLGEVQGARHRGLVDDHDRPVIQRGPGSFGGRVLVETVVVVEPLRKGVGAAAGRLRASVAARADGASPTTRYPACCHAREATPRVLVFPAPAGAVTTVRKSPAPVRCWTARGWPASNVSLPAATGWDVPAPAESPWSGCSSSTSRCWGATVP